METKLQMLDKGPQVNVQPDGLNASLKMIVIWKKKYHC